MYTKKVTKFVVRICASLTVLLSSAKVAIAAPPATMAVELKNPLEVNSITDLLEALLGIVIVLATPVVVFFIIYSGFLYVTARGNAEQVKQANRSLTYAIIGGVIVIGAFAVAEIVKNLVDSFV
jgi:hypothetical protein